MPEVKDLKVSESLFEKIKYNRKSKDYKAAIEIARLLLMNYHPDVTKGKNNVLALMFDMNILWEEFVYISLRKQLEDYEVKPQSSKVFWQKTTGYNSTVYLRPDIVISKEDKQYVLDTKWKLVEKNGASIADLRQMFAYNHYFAADKTALFYPATESNSIHGKFCNTDKTCSILKQQLPIEFAEWQKMIGDEVRTWIEDQTPNTTIQD
jgi:5-methylcytosine-specific restriction enzyme subunit McrC